MDRNWLFLYVITSTELFWFIKLLLIIKVVVVVYGTMIFVFFLPFVDRKVGGLS